MREKINTLYYRQFVIWTSIVLLGAILFVVFMTQEDLWRYLWPIIIFDTPTTPVPTLPPYDGEIITTFAVAWQTAIEKKRKNRKKARAVLGLILAILSVAAFIVANYLWPQKVARAINLARSIDDVILAGYNDLNGKSVEEFVHEQCDVPLPYGVTVLSFESDGTIYDCHHKADSVVLKDDAPSFLLGTTMSCNEAWLSPGGELVKIHTVAIGKSEILCSDLLSDIGPFPNYTHLDPVQLAKFLADPAREKPAELLVPVRWPLVDEKYVASSITGPYFPHYAGTIFTGILPNGSKIQWRMHLATNLDGTFNGVIRIGNKPSFVYGIRLYTDGKYTCFTSPLEGKSYQWFHPNGQFNVYDAQGNLVLILKNGERMKVEKISTDPAVRTQVSIDAIPFYIDNSVECMP